MVVGAGDRHHFFRFKGFAEHNEGLHDLRHGFALFAVQNFLLFCY
jgi:hypothetical protein